MTAHGFFKQLDLFQLIAKKESFLAPVFFLLFLTLIFQAIICHTKSRIKLQWVVSKFRILYIFSFFNPLLKTHEKWLQRVESQWLVNNK